MSDKPTPLDIAIVGRSCLFPGANSVKEYWENTLSGNSQINTVAKSRWGINLESAYVKGGYQPDHTYCPKGGYVSGFDKIFDADGFNLPADLIRKLGPVFQWILHCGRAALEDAGLDLNKNSLGQKSGIVMGNLSYPTDTMTDWAQEYLIREALPQLKSDIKTDPHNFFMSGLPAELLAQAVGFKGGVYALDAACASSLYAIGHACKALRRGDWDLALAGAINHSDSLFINFGFCALGALSASGESRPFDDRADGLIPGEGAGFIVLKRLEDAVDANDHIYGVIKAVSLGNDGHARNLLAPDKDGQVRCMKEAYRLSGIKPQEIDYLECHATGTPVGDKTEIEAIAEVWAGCNRAPQLGSAKAAIGHLVTAAGIAGVLKVISAIEHKTLPRQINCEQPVDILSNSAVTLADTPREWVTNNTRKAAVSAFGFGGNNAHILIEEWIPKTKIKAQIKTIKKTPLAIVGLGLAAAGLDESADVIDAIFVPDPQVKPGRRAELAVKLKGLRFPPADLKAALAQQILLFETARRAMADCVGTQKSPQKSGVIVGMACDPDTTKYGLRWRLERLAAEWNKQLKLNLDHEELADWISTMQETVIEKLKSEGVVGRMPNILANRLSNHFNFQGPGFTVSSEEVSGLRALEEAAHLLQAGEVDVMMVASVDMAADKMVVEALNSLGVDIKMTADDAAVVMIVKRLADAVADGDRIIARIDDIFSDSATATTDKPSEELLAQLSDDSNSDKLLYVDCSINENPLLEKTLANAHKVNPFAQIGYARVSSGLTGLAVAVLSCHLKKIPPSDKGENTSRPWITAKKREALVHCSSIGSSRYLVRLSESSQGVTRSVVKQPQSILSNKDFFIIKRGSDSIMFNLPAPKTAEAQYMEPAPTLKPIIMLDEIDYQRFIPKKVSLPKQAATAVKPPEQTSKPLAQLAKKPAEFKPVAQPSAGIANDVNSYIAAFSARQEELYTAHQRTIAQLSAAHTEYLRFLDSSNRQLARLANSEYTPISQPSLSLPQTAPQAPVFTQPAAQAATATAVLEPTPKPRIPEPVVEQPAKTITPPAQKIPESVLFDRDDLIHMASGKISDKFGPEFKAQDDYDLQVRMPMPPLLLCDRVISIDAEPGALKPATIVTETTVGDDSWYLVDGRMPAGIMIEAGQADLLLVSYLGVDYLNNFGKRMYRLLGCNIQYHRALPAKGDVLRYTIKINSFAKQGDIMLFYFQYDCHINDELAISVRDGCAGFFTLEELNESKGVIWEPSEIELSESALTEKPRPLSSRTSLSRDELLAFADGDLTTAFGPGFEIADTHTRTPSIPKGDLLLIDEVEVIDTKPTKNHLAYLRSTYKVSPDDWFFDGHFHNDPCMPGTLMFEVCLQNLEIFLGYLGATLKYDGFRFEPIKKTPDQLRCRGQVITSSKEMIYETYITDYGLEPYPWVKAQVRVSVDGLACLHCSDIGLEMVLDWPLYETLGSEKLPQDERHSIYDYRSLLACATGKPSDAFGELWEPMNHRRLPRLPGDPYHFMSRVTKVTDCPIAVMKTGGKIEIEYDVPPDAWYFKDNPSSVMPFSILLEVALQPCGWLASYIGSYHGVEEELSFRNLDGKGVVYGEITPDSGIVTTKCEVTSLSAVSGMKIQSFKVEVVCKEQKIYELTTVFGFFPLAALEAQVGIEFSEEESAFLDKTSDFTRVDLADRPAKYFDGPLALPARQLLMLNQVSAFWPDGGKAGLGFIRAEKLPTYKDWYFKAHFFGDPVQPGSLGLEAMFQLLQFYLIETGIGKDVPDPSFEYIRLNQEHSWKYRGQVIPSKKKVSITADITEINVDADHPYVVADCTLWVDGLKIYTATDFAVAVKQGNKTRKKTKQNSTELPIPELPLIDKDTIERSDSSLTASKTFDPARHNWLNDHRPTYLIPTLPLTVMMELICEAAQAFAPALRVISLLNTKASSWMAFTDGAAEVKTEVSLLSEENGKLVVSVSLLSYKQRKNDKLSRFESFFSGEIILGDEYPKVTTEETALQPLSEPDGRQVKGDELYTDGIMFHGPALQLLDFIKTGAKNGVSAVIRNEKNEDLIGILSPLTLDAVHHAIPVNHMELWDEEMEAGFFSFPYGIEDLKLFGPPPKATRLRSELRFTGHFEDNPRLPMCRFNLYDGLADDANIWISATFIYVSLPQGRLGACPTNLRKDFIIEKKMCENVSMARISDAEAAVTLSEVKQQDWLEGTMARVYLKKDELDEYQQRKLNNPAKSLEWLGLRIAAKEFAALRLKLHPIDVTLAEDDSENTLTASSLKTPFNQLKLNYSIDRDSETVVRVAEVENKEGTSLVTDEVMPFWSSTINLKGGLLEEVFLSLIKTFVGKIHFDDYSAYQKLKGQTCIYLANHQVGIESILFTLTLSSMNDSLIIALNKLENKSGWFGKIIDFCFSYPEIENPNLMLYFNRKKPQELLNLLGNMKETLRKGNKSLLVHVEGTRMTQSGQEIQKLSSIWIDLALKQNLPIVPLSFRGGLPKKALAEKLEFPVGMGKQDFYLGKPIMPANLKELPLVKQIDLVRTAINNLGPGTAEQPNPPNEELTQMIGKWSKTANAHIAMSTIIQTMVYANRHILTVLEPGVHRITDTFQAIGNAVVTKADNPETRVGFVIPQSIDARWIGKLTKMAFGSNGPAVLERLPKFKKFDVIIQAGKEKTV